MRVAEIVSLLRARHIEAASRLIEDVIRTEPSQPQNWRAAGILYAWQHNWEQAQEAFGRALAFQPVDATWWSDVALALLGAGAPGEACTIFERILAEGVNSQPGIFIHYGEALELAARLDEAKGAFARAMALDVNSVEACEGLVRTCEKLCDDEEALALARRAAQLRRFSTYSLHLLADALFQSGYLPSCLRTYRRARRRDPESAEVHAGYLFASMHDPQHAPSDLRAAHEDWFATHAGRTCSEQIFTNPRNEDRPLRIGYLSSEFHTSPTQFFLLPLLKAHDRNQFISYCYDPSRVKDGITTEYKAAAQHWRDLPGLDAKEIREAIIKDEIDILVDASGLFYPRITPLFKTRSAPVQVALPVYPCTRGCREIDYLISDRWTTPENAGFESHYSEGAIFRVPSGYVLYGPPENSPAITSLPASSNDYVTFGLYQRPAKFNDQLWAAICEIVRRTPHSHLLVHYASADLDNPASKVRARIAKLLADNGIASHRVEFVGRRNLTEHLATVARADIALDTFPYSGHTTTCDSLWMGVPAVSFAGATHASRVSAGLLARVGLEEWAVPSLELYVAKAVEAAQSVEQLVELRASLRSRMQESSICRHEIVVREIEAGYREMWREWCARSSVMATAAAD